MPPHHHVFHRGHLPEQANVLEGARNTGLGHFMHGGGAVGLAFEHKFARIRLIQAGNHIEKRGFTGTIGAD